MDEPKQNQNANEHDSLSDRELEIDLHAKKHPRRTSSPLFTTHDKDIIESIEGAIGKKLTEKVEQSKLTVNNVKSIIKEVFCDENFRTLLEENPSKEKLELTSYQPKITRAKAKEYLQSNNIPVPANNLPWVPQPPPSEIRVLIGEDLKEDDSGDEYIPGEDVPSEVSEDEIDDSIASESDVSSLPPPTPPTPCTNEELAPTPSYTDDGIFKIPLPKTAQEEADEEAANIALRTRSKINLSSTPIEVIEKNLITPDIKTCTHDMECPECDDADWKDFLKGFFLPIEEIAKPNEDDDHDPEYNIMADAEIDDVDKEDFRVDKTTKITKKEVKELWDELFDSLQNMSDDGDAVKNKNNVNETQENPENSEAEASRVQQTNENDPSKTLTPSLDLGLDYQQMCMLEQQMRQHIQMLTQNFVLTYEHLELHEYSQRFREYLLNLQNLAEGKVHSTFRAVNLKSAVSFTDQWIELYASNSEEVKKTKESVEKELKKFIYYKNSGNHHYSWSFPELILKTISKSDVFIYPSLLPRTPYESTQGKKFRGYLESEDRLLVFGLDLFKKFLSENQKKVPYGELVAQVHKHYFPHRELSNFKSHITQFKHPRCATNPIKQYLLYKKLEPYVHCIYPLNDILPPCKRKPNELPHEWKKFIYKNVRDDTQIQSILQIHPIQAGAPQQLLLLTGGVGGSPVCITQINLTQKPPRKKYIRKSLNATFDCIASNISNNSSSNHDQTLIDSIRSNIKTSTPYKPRSKGRNVTPIENLISILRRPLSVQKLINFMFEIDKNIDNMPTLNTPVKKSDATEESTVTSTTSDVNYEEKKEESSRLEIVTSSTMSQDTKKEKSRNLEFSTITSSSFQEANRSTEVEFSKNVGNVQIQQTLQCGSRTNPVMLGGISSDGGKANLEEKNVSPTTKTDQKPSAKKELSGAEKKKNKLRKDFLANISIATPDDPETEKHKNEMFAVAYYDKLRETLELNDYHKIMQILNDFTSGDVIDLYHNVQLVLNPKYSELADEFIFFLREREASAVGQLVPWIELQNRVKFLRKLEICMKDQPAQLKKIYNTLMELSKTKDLNMDKIKGLLIPMLKGNTMLLDLFLQNFRDERPPQSLLEGPYETIDINKEIARPDDEELYETFVVPNSEDKYGGSNCICHCHRIEDNEYKSRYKHCNSCGLKFANGKLFLSARRVLQPATVTFKTSPQVDHTARLLGKSVHTSRKKRCDTSPNKHKENLEEDTEDEDQTKRKRPAGSQKTPRKRKKTGDSGKTHSPKKSPGRSNELDIHIKPRKRTYSGKRGKKDEVKRIESDQVKDKGEMPEAKNENVDEGFENNAEIEDKSEHGANEEPVEKSIDDCMDSSGESLEKPLTPGQQTAESESEVYLEESSQDNYASDDSSSSMESAKGSQSDSNIDAIYDEPPWERDEDKIILETIQKEDDKEYALQIVSDKLPNRTIEQIRNRLSWLYKLLLEALNNK